jgi:hypothetical protein
MNNYQTDFFKWTREQAELLKAGCFDRLDIGHLIEELETMGASERRELLSRLEELLMHLLKWRYQPGLRGASWEVSIIKQRDALEDLFEASPSLRPRVHEVFDKAYKRARVYASKETGLALSMFPESCVWTIEEVLRSDFWPVE